MYDCRKKIHKEKDKEKVGARTQKHKQRMDILGNHNEVIIQTHLKRGQKQTHLKRVKIKITDESKTYTCNNDKLA